MLSNTALGVSVGACTFLFKSERGTVSVQFVSHTRPCNRHDNGLHGRSARLRVHSRRQNMVRGERLHARHLRPILFLVLVINAWVALDVEAGCCRLLGMIWRRHRVCAKEIVSLCTSATWQLQVRRLILPLSPPTRG